ncbi:MAG: hydrogenase maturation protease [Deltaproteobacteria bacterium]|nr:hydrogenase maturation protease [Deltaproteobacteria bacterium]
MYKEMTSSRVLIFGCGNVLMGDDGFGPAVVKKLRQKYRLPPDAHVEDVGTSIRDLLFNIALLPQRPERIIVMDAVDKPGRSPGEVFEIDLDAIPESKAVDYSIHQCPTSNLLKEIRDLCGVEVTVVAAQVAKENEQVGPGLSEPVRGAVREAAERIAKMVKAR